MYDTHHLRLEDPDIRVTYMVSTSHAWIIIVDYFTRTRSTIIHAVVALWGRTLVKRKHPEEVLGACKRMRDWHICRYYSDELELQS